MESTFIFICLQTSFSFACLAPKVLAYIHDGTPVLAKAKTCGSQLNLPPGRVVYYFTTTSCSMTAASARAGAVTFDFAAQVNIG
jgi:hypothetical protein